MPHNLKTLTCGENQKDLETVIIERKEKDITEKFRITVSTFPKCYFISRNGVVHSNYTVSNNLFIPNCQAVNV
jgi:hypothetical protein